jgi:hypothetical protein
MSDGSTNTEKTAEQWAAFQKIWTDSFTKMMQLGFTSPEAAPPEFLRQIRGGIFQALSQSWDEFMRSPQFLESMKQWMENAMAFRKMSNDFLTKARHETQAPAREDIDATMQAVHHMETRVLDRMEDLAKQVEALTARVDKLSGGKSRPTKLTSAGPRAAKNRRRGKRRGP